MDYVVEIINPNSVLDDVAKIKQEIQNLEIAMETIIDLNNRLKNNWYDDGITREQYMTIHEKNMRNMERLIAALGKLCDGLEEHAHDAIREQNNA